MQRQIPWNSDARALMHEWRAVDFCVKDAEPKQPPLVERLRCPDAKEGPAKFPKHTQKALACGPRGRAGGFRFRRSDPCFRHARCEEVTRHLAGMRRRHAVA